MSRDAESIRLEAEYWQHVCRDLAELTSVMPEIASPLVSAHVSLLEVAVAVMPQSGSSVANAIEVVGQRINESLEIVRRAQAVAAGIGELLDGRLIVLAREISELNG